MVFWLKRIFNCNLSDSFFLLKLETAAAQYNNNNNNKTKKH